MSLREDPFNLFRGGKGIMPNRREFERLGQAVGRATSISGQGVFSGAAGTHFALPPAPFYYAKLTAIDQSGDHPRYSWRLQVPDPTTDSGWADYAGHAADLSSCPAFEANDLIVEVPSFQILYPADSGCTMYFWAGGGESSFLARLTGKSFPGGFIAYSWVKVEDSGSVTFTDVPEETGGPGDFPAYDLNNVDYPVLKIVRLRRGSGDYYLIEGEPRVEFVRLLGSTPDANGYYSAFLQAYDQGLGIFVDVEPVLVLDANAG